MKRDQAADADAATAVQVTTLEQGVSTAGSPVALAASGGTRTVWRYGKKNRRSTLIVTVLWNALMTPGWYLLLRGGLEWGVAALGAGFALIGLLLIAGSVITIFKKLVVVVDGDRVLAGSGLALGDPPLAPICRTGDVRAVRLVEKQLFILAALRPREGERPPPPRPGYFNATLALRDGGELPLVDEIDGREPALALARSLAATLGLGAGAIELDGRRVDELCGAGDKHS